MSQPMEEQTSKVFGGCEGPDAMYVKLISSDGHEFIGEFPIGHRNPLVSNDDANDEELKLNFHLSFVPIHS